MNLLLYYIGLKLNTVVQAKDFVVIEPDRILLCDALGPQVFEKLERANTKPQYDLSKVFATCGRNFPPRDINTANYFLKYKNQLAKYKPVFLGTGHAGVIHNVFMESGAPLTGEFVLGTDSHTLAVGAKGSIGMGIGVEDAVGAILYKKFWLKIPSSTKIVFQGSFNAPISIKDVTFYLMNEIGCEKLVGRCIEFYDESEQGLTEDDKMVLTTHATEFGATTAFFPEKTAAQSAKPKDADYELTYKFNLSKVEKRWLAYPDDPFNLKQIIGDEAIKITYCLLGTCSGGGIQGMREAAHLIRNKKKHPDIVFMVVPQSAGIYQQAIQEGLISDFINFGATVTTPTCGPCLASHSGVLSEKDICLTTGNRNFKGRMGDAKAKIYLASPISVALAAINGQIT